MINLTGYEALRNDEVMPREARLVEHPTNHFIAYRTFLERGMDLVERKPVNLKGLMVRIRGMLNDLCGPMT